MNPLPKKIQIQLKQFQRKGMICKVLKGFWMGMVFLWIVGCTGDDSYMNSGGYCQNWSCKPFTDVLQRPTTFALELQLNDSADSRVAKLYTLDCQFLPDEDSLALSTFCVDSLKYGESDSLRHLPQKNKNSYDVFSDLSVKTNGRILEKYIKIPIDDDDHLRFTLVDRKNKQKAFDVDLSAFIKMYELHGDTFDFRFPDSTTFSAFTRDTTFSEKDCAVPFTDKRESECYYYSVYDTPYMDTTVYCIAENGSRDEHFHHLFISNEGTLRCAELNDIGDSSACKSQQFYVLIEEQKPWHGESVDCDMIDLVSVPELLSLSNLYSRRLVNDIIVDSLGSRMYRWDEDLSDSDLVDGNCHSWHTVSWLGGQGPDGEDDFTIYTVYRD